MYGENGDRMRVSTASGVVTNGFSDRVRSRLYWTVTRTVVRSNTNRECWQTLTAQKPVGTRGDETSDASTESRYAKGFITSTPAASKGEVSLVATTKSRLDAMAAINASKSPIARPAACAFARKSP